MTLFDVFSSKSAVFRSSVRNPHSGQGLLAKIYIRISGNQYIYSEILVSGYGPGGPNLTRIARIDQKWLNVELKGPDERGKFR